MAARFFSFSTFHNKKKILFVSLLITLSYLFIFSKSSISNKTSNELKRTQKNDLSEVDEEISDLNENSTKSIFYNLIESTNLIINKLKSSLNRTQCEIINRTHKQYRASFDGVSYPQYLFLNQNHSINFDCVNREGKMKTILAWNRWYGEHNFGYGAGKRTPFVNRNCPVNNCEITEDRSRVNESDMVMVLMTDVIEQQIPSSRAETQRWIFVLIESPYHTGDFNMYNNVFNLTADYLSESDFGNNYESQKRFLWKENLTFDESFDYHANRSGFMAALISNCNAQNARLAFIEEMQKFVQVKVFGRCGSLCPGNGDCREMIGNEFKFFFAFENSVCRDYITEKFFLMLKFNTVPVVLGGGNYSRFIPKSGYINAMDFESPKQLANYLLYLDRNKTAYNSYFQWKKHVHFTDYTVEYGFICDICIRAHLDSYFGIQKKVIQNLGEYWNRQKQCKDVKISYANNTNEKIFKFE